MVAASVGQSRGLWKQLARVLDECRGSGVTEVRLMWVGGGVDLLGRPSPARRIADDWQMEVIAPAGPVVVAPGGSMFAPPEPGGLGGWWRFTPGLSPRPLGLRHPVPSWEDAAAHVTPDAIGGHVVEPVPAGLLIRPAEPLSDAARAVGASVPVDEHRLAVVVGAPAARPVPAQALAELLGLLPLRARAAVRLIPGDGRDLLTTCQETADLLSTEVEVVSGVPVLLERAGGTGTESAVVLFGADGEPSWRPYAEVVACVPAQGRRAPAPRLVQWRPPVAGLAVTPENGVMLLDAIWQVSVTRAGLWVGPRGAVRPETSGWAVTPETMLVDVGVPGQRLDDGLWPVLDTLVEGLEPSVSGRTTLHVLGSCGARGRRMLRNLTRRRGLSLEYSEDALAGRESEGPGAEVPEPAQGRTADPATPNGDAPGTAPWNASPMRVRIRRAAAPPSPVLDSPAAPAPSAAKAPVPPGFAEALTASRSVRGTGSRSVPASWDASHTAPVEGPVSVSVPGAAESTAAAPVPPVSAAPPPPSPAPAPAPAPAQGAAPEHVPAPTTPVRRTALPVRVTPLHRSSPSDRQTLRALAGEQWWQHQATVTRALTMMPGLRMQDPDEDVHADLIAVRCFVARDDGPLSWTWLERQLAAGSGDAFSYLTCLASGLRRLPSHRGVVVRDAGVLPPEARTLSPGRELCEAGPVATFTLDGAPPSAADRYLIWSATGRRVGSLFASPPAAGNGEEIVFGPGTRFRVLRTQGQPGAVSVLLREVADGAPAARSGEPDAQDRAALEALLQAVGRAPAADAVASWSPRLTGQLVERLVDGGGSG
ncbi:hypothetical protein [Streptomyces sp.]|uniref:hypothetical protein n=1 Tax=Streptomyces sp. TaxID=1931 RepID=UPI002F3F588F